MKVKLSLWLAGIGLASALLPASPAHANVSIGFSGIYSWGRNNWGQLGKGNTIDANTPQLLGPGSASNYALLAAGFGHNVIEVHDASVGVLATWGAGQYGQLGLGSNGFLYIPAFLGVVPPASPIAVGAWHTAFIESGSLGTSGYNFFGQLGDGTNTDKNTPQTIANPNANAWTAVSGGGHHTLAFDSTGELYAWGNNTFGQLGTETNTDTNAPIFVSGSVTGLSAGGYHSAVQVGTNLYTTGYNFYGQLGDGTNNNRNSFFLVLTGASSVSCGAYHTLALMTDGTVQATGRNNFGQLGDGTTTTRNTWAAVSGLSNIIAISAGAWHNLAVDISGNVYAWGYNAFGELGCGNNINQLTPILIGVISDTSNFAISAGWYHSLLYAAPLGT